MPDDRTTNVTLTPEERANLEAAQAERRVRPDTDDRRRESAASQWPLWVALALALVALALAAFAFASVGDKADRAETLTALDERPTLEEVATVIAKKVDKADLDNLAIKVDTKVNQVAFDNLAERVAELEKIDAVTRFERLEQRAADEDARRARALELAKRARERRAAEALAATSTPTPSNGDGRLSRLEAAVESHGTRLERLEVLAARATVPSQPPASSPGAASLRVRVLP